MSLTTYFVLLNRARLEAEVEFTIAQVLAGHTDVALHILSSRQLEVAEALDHEPLAYFKHCVQLAIDTLEGRIKDAFVNEITPLITDPTEAWRHNVNVLVRSGLALSMCAVQPGPGISGSFRFWLRHSALIREWSHTADEAADRDNPALMERTRIGIFEEPEMFLAKSCLERIAQEIQPLLRTLPKLSESAETCASVQHFDRFISAPMRDPDLAILRGFL
jgi:hypothetical protein